VVKLTGRGESVSKSFWCHHETRDATDQEELNPLSVTSEQQNEQLAAFIFQSCGRSMS